MNGLLTTGKNRVTADGTKDNFTNVQTLSRGHSEGAKVHGTTEGLALVGIGHNGSNDVAIDHIERGRDIGRGREKSHLTSARGNERCANSALEKGRA